MASTIEQVITDKYALYNGDCVQVLKGIPDDSIGFSVFSPPFADLYCYSDSKQDMGNCKDYADFFVHFEFLVKQLKRVMMPGRVIAVHCMDLPMKKSVSGHVGLIDFPGDLRQCFEEHGFIYCARTTIWKDPLIAATRTKALGLSHRMIVKDSAVCRTAIADTLLCFRKKGENPVPIKHKKGLKIYHGSTRIPNDLERFADHDDPKTNKRSHWIWQQYASPVWMDIRQSRVLPYRQGKDKDDTKHICPLQLDVIERCLELWSTKGDTVLTPFMGIGSEAYCAVKRKRKAIGIELKRSYFRQAVRNLKSIKKGNFDD